MLDTSRVEEYLTEVKAHAEKIGLADQFQKQLDYLDRYANDKGEGRCEGPDKSNDKTECVLYKDFAPFSFVFDIFTRERSFSAHVHECEECGKTFEDEVPHEKCFFWTEGKGECGGQLKVVGIRHRKVERSHWFGGGLIFHGPHDNGGDGGMPTLSVNLSPQNGWSVHT